MESCTLETKNAGYLLQVKRTPLVPVLTDFSGDNASVAQWQLHRAVNATLRLRRFESSRVHSGYQPLGGNARSLAPSGAAEGKGSFMGTFDDSMASQPSSSKSHNKTRQYIARSLTADRDKFRQHVTEKDPKNLWVVTVMSSDRGIDTCKLQYGPAHGNSPSDVKHLFTRAGITLVDEVTPTGKPVHVVKGCRHADCVKHLQEK